MRSVQLYPKYLRLFIYSYLDLKTTIDKISILSKKEREELLSSAIAREGKKLRLEAKHDGECLLHGNKLSIFLSRIQFQLCQKIKLIRYSEESKKSRCKKGHKYSDELIEILTKLP